MHGLRWGWSLGAAETAEGWRIKWALSIVEMLIFILLQGRAG